MKKHFILLAFVFFLTPFTIQAETYTDDFETLDLGLIQNGITNTGVDSLLGDIRSNWHADLLIWTEVIDKGCFSGSRCIENFGTQYKYSFNTEMLAFMNSNIDNYISFWIKVPDYPEISTGENMTNLNFATVRSASGQSQAKYWLICKETSYSFSLLLTDDSADVNNCATSISKVGEGILGGWNQVQFKLDSASSTLKAQLNESEWSIPIDVNDYRYGFTDITIHGKDGYLLEDDYELNKEQLTIDDITIADDDISQDNFELDYTLGIVNEDWTQEDLGCDINVKQYCGIATTSYAFVIQASATSTIDDWKYEWRLFNYDGKTLEPRTNFEKTFYYDFANSIIQTNPVIFPESDKKIYLLNVCVASQERYPILFGEGDNLTLCKKQYIGNGYTDELLGEMLLALGLISSTSTVNNTPDAVDWWTTNDCDNIGLTDVFKGVKCAMIWAFAPNSQSLEKFSQTKSTIMSVYPIGYASLIVNDLNDSFSTTTNAFDRDIEVKKFFGQTGGTTTISVEALTSEIGMVQPILDYFDTIIWIVFVCWLVYWGLTRKL